MQHFETLDWPKVNYTTFSNYTTFLFDFLTNSSVYDSRERPAGPAPVEVRNSMFVYFLGHVDTQGMQFDVHFLIRQRWKAVMSVIPWCVIQPQYLCTMQLCGWSTGTATTCLSG